MIKRFIKYRYLNFRRKRRYLPVVPPYKYCKNCGNELTGKYCSVCGQYAVTDKHILNTSVSSYLENTYAFDRRIWTTLFYLIAKPGFISREYLEGRIVRYTHPFKFYFFASILFFGIALSTNSADNNKKILDNDNIIVTDNDDFDDLVAAKAQGKKAIPKNISGQNQKDSVTVKNDFEFHIGNDDPNDKAEKKINENIKKNLKTMTEHDFVMKMKQNISYSMLFLMPLFGLLLWLAFHKKEKRYSPHLILSVHVHILLFLLLTLGLSLDHLFSIEITGYLFLAWFLHFILTMSNFYKERKRKCIVKAMGILFFYSIAAIIVTVIALFSILTL